MRKILHIFLLLLLVVGYQSTYATDRDVEVKRAILLVSFGTSYPEARVAFDNIEESVKSEFPGVEIRWAFTSKMIRKILKRRGEDINSPAEALAEMGEDGFTHVAVQSLHIIPGQEYDDLKHTVEAFNGMPKGIQVSKLGKPLLFTDSDSRALASFINSEYSSLVKKRSSVIFMGHGTVHASNIYYPGFQYYLNQKSDGYFIGTVEGFPTLDNIVPGLEANGVKRVTLIPFMSVAGDHAKNDMAGEGSDSWRSILEARGFKVDIVLKGLAESDDVVRVWIDHLKEIYSEL